MSEPKFPHVHVQLTGEDDNVMAVMARVSKAMRRAGVPKTDIDAYLAEAMSGDYNHLLAVAMQTVNVS